MLNIAVNKIRSDFYSMEFGAVRCFMFIGEDRVLLVDAGFPKRGLVEKIREITDLPIEVIYSHSDGDHIGDYNEFDSPFMHPADMDYFYSKTSENIKLRPLWEGQVINIASYELEVILIPGHTPGSIGLLEKNHRFMLTGDTVHYGPVHMFGPGRNLQAYLYSLNKIKDLSDWIDVFYNCHHKLEASIDILDDLILGVQNVIDGRLEGTTKTMKGMLVKLYSFGEISFYGT